MKTNNALTYFTVLICTTSLFNCINSYTVEQVKIDFSKPIKTFTAGELKKYDGSQVKLGLKSNNINNKTISITLRISMSMIYDYHLCV